MKAVEPADRQEHRVVAKQGNFGLRTLKPAHRMSFLEHIVVTGTGTKTSNSTEQIENIYLRRND